MTLFRTAAALRQALGRAPLALVPTMGALHEGHLSLVRRAQKQYRQVAVSIFVNPTQFGPSEDYTRYPRTLAADRRLLAGLGKVLVYAPSVSEVYPSGFSTAVRVGGSLGSVLEAAWRPGHFDGVATVVARLFGLLRPQHAYFGLKDYQQFLVIRRMTRDLGLPVQLTGCPTLREADGLAMSSRNRYLSAEDRDRATALRRALLAARDLARSGERSAARLEAAGLRVLRSTPGLVLQYFNLADARDLAPLRALDRPALLLTAVKLGSTRLIDNLPLRP